MQVGPDDELTVVASLDEREPEPRDELGPQGVVLRLVDPPRTRRVQAGAEHGRAEDCDVPVGVEVVGLVELPDAEGGADRGAQLQVPAAAVGRREGAV